MITRGRWHCPVTFCVLQSISINLIVNVKERPRPCRGDVLVVELWQLIKHSPEGAPCRWLGSGAREGIAGVVCGTMRFLNMPRYAGKRYPKRALSYLGSGLLYTRLWYTAYAEAVPKDGTSWQCWALHGSSHRLQRRALNQPIAEWEN